MVPAPSPVKHNDYNYFILLNACNFAQISKQIYNQRLVSTSEYFLKNGNDLFCGEGPRSRCYGHTTALRLIVQPCVEDEENDDQFFHFSK
jgi:hypothetical protein